MKGKLRPTQGGVLTGDVFLIDINQGLQADHAGDTNTTKPLSKFSSDLLLQYIGCIAYNEPSRNTTESQSFLLFRICMCQTNGIGRIRMATSVARFKEASII